MKYIIFTIILLTVISLFVNDKSIENFQGTSSSTESNVTTQSISDKLSSININDRLVESNNLISFDNLNINSMSNELLESIENKINLDISNINDNKIAEMGIDISKRYNLEDDIKKLKLINTELNRRRQERKNRFHLMGIKDKLDRLKKYDECNGNCKLDIYSTCPQEPFAYDEINSDFQKYDLDITRHPNKWYGLQYPNLKNKLPYNFYVH